MVESSKPLEKVGMDITALRHKKYLLVAVDYHTRVIKAEVADSKETQKMIEAAEKIRKEWGSPQMLITEERCEFTSCMFKQWCKNNGITHHTTAPDKHQSNERVERAIRKIWPIIRKEMF